MFRFSIFCVASSVFDHSFDSSWHTFDQPLQYSLDISFTQTSFIAFTNSAPLNGCFSDTLFFMLVHKFSMGFKSGLFPGHSRRSMLLLSRKFFATLERWQGAPSCIIFDNCELAGEVLASLRAFARILAHL